MHLSLICCDMQYPFFSIIISTYNRPRQLTKCLQSLTRLRYSRDCFEVIVVDDGSKLLAKDVVANVDDLLDITLIRQENGVLLQPVIPVRNMPKANSSFLPTMTVHPPRIGPRLWRKTFPNAESHYR